MFSVTYTGINLFPLCTAMVCPTKSGEITEALAQVFKTDFLPVSFIASTFSQACKQCTYFNERLMFLSFKIISSYVQQYTCWMLSSGHGFCNLWQAYLSGNGDDHRRHGFTTTHRVIHRFIAHHERADDGPSNDCDQLFLIFPKYGLGYPPHQQ